MTTKKKYGPEDVNPLIPPRPTAKKRAFKNVSTVKPGESHPGQTAEHGHGHDRQGSQPERMKHLYPNGNVPKQGAARSNKAPRPQSPSNKEHRAR